MSKFRPLTVVLPIERIMKEAIRMVLEFIYYDPELFRKGRTCRHSALRRIKEEWGTPSPRFWFLEFDIGNMNINKKSKCFTIDRHRLISIFKEEIDDPKFEYSIHQLKVLVGLVGNGEKGRPVPNNVLLSALLAGNIYLHKLDQEIGSIRQKYEIPPIVQRIMVLLRASNVDRTGLESFPQDTSRDITDIVGSIQRKAFHYYSFSDSLTKTCSYDSDSPKLQLVSSFRRGGPPQAGFGGRCDDSLCTSSKRVLEEVRSSKRLAYSSIGAIITTIEETRKALSSFSRPALAFLNKPSSLLYAFFNYVYFFFNNNYLSYFFLPEFRERCNNNCCMRYLDLLIKYKKRKVEELGILIRSERAARKLPLKTTHYLIRICYARYADDLLLGIVGAVELLIEIQKRIAHFTCGSTIARSTVEFLGTVIREVKPPRTTPNHQFGELEKRLRVKHRIHITAHLRSIHLTSKSIPKHQPKGTTVVQAPTLGTVRSSTGVKNVVLGGSRSKKGISLLHRSRKGVLSLYTGLWGGDTGRDLSPILQIEAPIKKILRRLRDRGLISRRRPWPIHVARLTNVSDEDIVNWFAGIAISLLSYYRCCDNLYQVRTIVDYQIRWSAIFTLAHKHKSSRNIIPKYSKDLLIVNPCGKILAEFPNSIKLGKLGTKLSDANRLC